MQMFLIIFIFSLSLEFANQVDIFELCLLSFFYGPISKDSFWRVRLIVFLSAKLAISHEWKGIGYHILYVCFL
jgi:hypothetical protein